MNMDIEAQAREFLAAEYERAGLDRAADRCRNGDLSAYMREPVAAIIAALTSAQGNADGEGEAVAEVVHDSFGMAHMVWEKHCGKGNQPPHGAKLYTRPAAQVQQEAAPKVSEEDLALCERGAGICEDDGSHGIAAAIRRVVESVRGWQ